jgi:hypothetical protein
MVAGLAASNGRAPSPPRQRGRRCREAAGEISTAEGIHSLARAFAYAGAKSVVGTLWKVEDRSATRFVKEMAAGDPAVGMAFMTIVVAAAGFWIRLH